MQLYELTIGDGHHRKKDAHMLIKTAWECDDMEEWLRKLVASCLPNIADDIEQAWADDTDDDAGVWLCIDEGPFGETDGYAGPWLVAELRKVEKKTEPARDEEQLDFARIWASAA